MFAKNGTTLADMCGITNGEKRLNLFIPRVRTDVSIVEKIHVHITLVAFVIKRTNPQPSTPIIAPAKGKAAAD